MHQTFEKTVNIFRGIFNFALFKRKVWSIWIKLWETLSFLKQNHLYGLSYLKTKWVQKAFYHQQEICTDTHEDRADIYALNQSYRIFGNIIYLNSNRFRFKPAKLLKPNESSGNSDMRTCQLGISLTLS